ncbi:MAG: HNH endonuclease signature motif containing protein [Pseudoxanthomonas sp.]
MTEAVKPREGAFSSKGNWTREQTLLAFKLYCEMPFGQLDSRNKKIIALAEMIGRSPGAVAMKCVNIASLDPKIRESGRAGLSNASSLDRQIWEEAHADWGAVIAECETLLAFVHQEKHLPEPEVLLEDERDFTGAVRTALVKQRVGQAFFRRAVLSSYGERCCISGVNDKRFLVASHIVPWNEDAAIRLHPGNGLCLSAMHDKAFDKHCVLADRRPPRDPVGATQGFKG